MAADGLPTPENPGRLASAAAIANPFQAALSAATAARKAAGKRAPKLVGILATPSPPSVAYAEWTKKACEAVGIEFEIWRTWDEAAQDEPMDGQTPKPEGKSDAAAEPAAAEKPDMELEGDVEDLIIAANASDDVHGIMVSAGARTAARGPSLCAHAALCRCTTPSLADGKTRTCSRSSTRARTSRACTSATVGTCITTCAGSCRRSSAARPAPRPSRRPSTPRRPSRAGSR
jgi:hypothetical protein